MKLFALFLIALPFAIDPSLYAQSPFQSEIRRVSSLIERLDVMHADVLDKARAWRHLAGLQQDAALYSDSISSFKRAIGYFHDSPNATSELAEVLDGLGTLELETGQFHASEVSLGQARAMRLAANDTLGLARSDVHFANLYLGEHKYEKSHMLAAKALASFAKDEQADTLDKSSAMIAMSLALCRQNRCGEAVPTLETLVALTRRSYADDSLPVGFAFFLLGYADRANRDLVLADAYMKRGIDAMAQSLGWGHPMFLQALMQYSRLLRETDRINSAREIEAKARELQRRNGNQETIGIVDLASLP